MTRLRLIFLGLCFLFGFSLIVFRAAKLQFLPNYRIAALAERQHKQSVEIVGRRGVITDRNGRELAVSTNTVSVFANPKLIRKESEIVRQLAPVLSAVPNNLRNRLRQGADKKFIWLERQLDPEQLRKLQALDLKSFEGIGVLPEFRREYPNQSLAAHVLGAVSVDGKGLEGIEKQFDKALMGSKEFVKLSRDALGRPIFSSGDQIRLESSAGTRIELSLDTRLQYSVEKHLHEAIEKYQATGGSAIVMNPWNGEILAIASYPTFNPNNPGEYRADSRRNRVITDPIEPGSVVKPFVVARALEDNLVQPNTPILAGDGSIRVGKKTIREAEASHYRKWVTVTELIQHSSNVATVNLKGIMGFPRIEDVFRRVGFGSLLGIDLPGESKGIFNSPKPKQLLEQATISFGQGIAVTPLQIASAFCVLANSGYRVKPHVVRRTFQPDEIPTPFLEDVREIEASARVFSGKTISQMRKILTKVVQDEGTGVRAQVSGFEVAGKTGTSQRVDFRKGGYEKGAYLSLFSGFIPADNPRFVVSVIIDKPTQGGFYGGVVAAPVFSNIALAAMRLSSPAIAEATLAGNLDRKEPIKNAASPKKWLVSSDRNQIPELLGLPIAAALRVLEERGLRMQISGVGDTVAEQVPDPGSPITKDPVIFLKLR